MDWITGIQRAVDYIESRLTEGIAMEAVAKEAFLSSFYFQRIFRFLCGYTVAEYIRSRRLSLAGMELLVTNAKILDIALKYGYETPESFTRAFTRFHGITPSAARSRSGNLKSFARLSIKLSLEGGDIMSYRIEKMPGFRVAAKTKRFDSDNAQKEIPGFWGNCRQDGTLKALCACLKEDGLFGSALLGICEEDTSSPHHFPYSIGAEYNGAPLPEGLIIKEIPEYTWAIFECNGPMPGAMQELWHRIYASYFPTSDYQPFGGIDFEVYPEGDMDAPNYKSEIWVAVKKKQI